MQADIKFSVNDDRVLVPVGQPCPFGCKYCYTRGGEVGPMNFEVDEILDALEQFAKTHRFSTVQLGYDGDPFARPERGVIMIKRLAKLGKNINFSTKALVNLDAISALAEINETVRSTGCTLSAIISMSCWGSAPKIEPSTPAPSDRVAAMSRLITNGIPTFVAIRPILPHVLDVEYECVVQHSLDVGCSGFILGPLYSDSDNKFVRFIPIDELRKVPSKKIQVPWAPHEPTWSRYESRPRLERLSEVITARGGSVFESSIDAVKAIRAND